MNIPFLFVFFMLLFSFLGMIRGWTKELILTFSLVTGLALILMLVRYFPVIKELPYNSSELFWIRMIILSTMAYFGFQTVSAVPRLAIKANIRKPRDRVFGLLMGFLNGYLFASSGIYYLYLPDDFLGLGINQATSPAAMQMIQKLMPYMAPHILGEPLIYFTEILALIFVLIVFV